MAAPLAMLGPTRARIGLLVSCLLLSPSTVLAADALFVTVENTTGAPAADLHVTFAGTGGNIFVDPLSVHAAGCPVPAVTSNPPVVTATAVIDWGVECVAAGNIVTFIARTANGPLAVVSADWTDDTGAVIGPGAWDTDPLPPPPPGPNPFHVLKFWSQYVGGAKTYTLYQINEDQYLRECCRAAQWIFTTTYYCPNASRFGGLFEIGPWFPLKKVHSGFNKAKWIYTWEWVWFWGIRLEDCIPPVPFNQMPIGPPPSGYGDPQFQEYDPMDFGLDARYSDDAGQTWRQGTDFTSTFQVLAETLVTYMDTLETVTPVYTLPQIFTETGRKYVASAGVLSPLITEVNTVRVAEPKPLLDDIYQHLQDVQAACGAVGAHLQTGVANNPAPFQSLGQALDALAADIGDVSPSLRFDNAAAELSLAAAVAYDAANLAAFGLPDTISAAQFGSIMNGHIPGHMRGFAQAMWPHVAVQARVCDYAWHPSTIDAASVILTNLNSADPPDSLALRINDQGVFYIPTMHIPNGARLHIRFKLPTFLSVEFDVDYYVDGLRVGPVPLVGGDANNDDCINLIDLAFIGAHNGEGGWGWPTSVSTADVTGDGVVDQMDVDVVQYNFGRCGPIASRVGPTRTPPLVTLDAFPNPTERTASVRFDLPEEAAVTIRLYNVRGQEVAVIANRRYPAGSNDVALHGTRLPSGVYLCRLTATIGGATVHRVTKLTVLK
jgi:hypothetical protein